MTHNGPITPEMWISDLFRAKAARDGRVIRRNLRDIDRYVGRQAFLTKLDRRVFQAIENAGQLIIICNREPVRKIL